MGRFGTSPNRNRAGPVPTGFVSPEWERARRAKEAEGLKLLERENIPGAHSKAPPRNPGNLHFLRCVRFRHNTRLSCCTCHCISLLKYLVQSKGLSVMYHSSRNALGLCFFIAPLFRWLSPCIASREFMVRNIVNVHPPLQTNYRHHFLTDMTTHASAMSYHLRNMSLKNQWNDTTLKRLWILSRLFRFRLFSHSD